MKAYSVSVFDQGLIVATDSDEEKYDLNVIKDVDPFLPLRSLTTNVEHAICQAAKLEDVLVYASRSETSTKDVLIRGDVIASKEAVDVSKEAVMALAGLWQRIQ